MLADCSSYPPKARGEREILCAGGGGVLGIFAVGAVPQEMLARGLSAILEYIFPVPRTVPHREMGHAGMWGNFGSMSLKMWWVHVPSWQWVSAGALTGALSPGGTRGNRSPLALG